MNIDEMILQSSRNCLRCGLLIPMRITGTWVCSGCGLHWRYLNSDEDRLQYALRAESRWRDVPEKCLLVVESKEEV